MNGEVQNYVKALRRIFGKDFDTSDGVLDATFKSHFQNATDGYSEINVEKLTSLSATPEGGQSINACIISQGQSIYPGLEVRKNLDAGYGSSGPLADINMPLTGIIGVSISDHNDGELRFAHGLEGVFEPRATGTASYRSNLDFTGDIVGVLGRAFIGSSCGVDINQIAGVAAHLAVFLTQDIELKNYYGFDSSGFALTQGLILITNYYGMHTRPALDTDVTNYYGYYSRDKSGSETIGSFYHFYGEGDHPSFFGGEIQQTAKAITAANPPLQSELVSGLGSASIHPDASRDISVTDGTFFRVLSNGTSWYYNAYTIGA